MNLCGIEYDTNSPTFLSVMGIPYGWIESGGYTRCLVEGRKVGVHRVVLELHGISCEGKIVDPIDGNKTNNSISNLRLATSRENSHNQKIRSDNTSGCKGVSWSKQKGKWRVRITLSNGRSQHVGFFSELEEAIKAATKSREVQHGRFANHG